MPNETWRKRLKPFDEAYSALMQSIYDTVNAASDAELVRIIADCDKATEYNCGWTVYRVSKLVRREAVDEQIMRARVKEQADASVS